MWNHDPFAWVIGIGAIVLFAADRLRTVGGGRRDIEVKYPLHPAFTVLAVVVGVLIFAYAYRIV